MEKRRSEEIYRVCQFCRLQCASEGAQNSPNGLPHEMEAYWTYFIFTSLETLIITIIVVRIVMRALAVSVIRHCLWSCERLPKIWGWEKRQSLISSPNTLKNDWRWLRASGQGCRHLSLSKGNETQVTNPQAEPFSDAHLGPNDFEMKLWKRKPRWERRLARGWVKKSKKDHRRKICSRGHERLQVS